MFLVLTIQFIFTVHRINMSELDFAELSEDNSDCEVSEAETTKASEIFKCIEIINEKVEGEDTVLWPTPQIFYNYLIHDIPNDAKLLKFWSKGESDQHLQAAKLMEEVFTQWWPHEAQAMDFTLSELTISWNLFHELASGISSFSTSYPLELVISSLEHLKARRMSKLRKMKTSKKKLDFGQTVLAKRFKTQSATGAGKDPSLPYTSTSSRIMNTFTSSTTALSEEASVNALSWLESQSEGGNQSLFDRQPHLELNSGGLSQSITFHAQKEGEITSTYTWPVEECSTYLTMTLHPYKNAKKKTLKDVWTARAQTYKICIGKNNLIQAEALRVLTEQGIRSTDPRANPGVQCQKVMKKPAYQSY